MAFITCKQIVKAYRVGKHELVALRGIDFEMERGEMVAIIGPSGAGKSSLLNLLGGLHLPTAGQLFVDDLNLLELRSGALARYRLLHTGFVWQQIERNLLPNRSALRNVTLPMMLARLAPSLRLQRARELLDAVGMSAHQHKPPAALSGGQQQRVAIAAALANLPPLLLADEPTGALDRGSAAQVMALLRDLRTRYGLTVLLATHDMGIAAHADRVLTLRDGALGQEVSDGVEADALFDADGRVALPASARTALAPSARIAVEIRPEGVLLRPEAGEEDEIDVGVMPQDAPLDNSSARGRLWSRLRRKTR